MGFTDYSSLIFSALSAHRPLKWPSLIDPVHKPSALAVSQSDSRAIHPIILCPATTVIQTRLSLTSAFLLHIILKHCLWELKFRCHKLLPEGHMLGVSSIPGLRVGLHINCIASFHTFLSRYKVVVCPFQRSMKLINFNSTYKLRYGYMFSFDSFILFPFLSNPFRLLMRFSSFE